MDALAVVGPTSVGKSGLALCLAERIGGEIVSMDSRQSYRRIDVGTAKPTPAERERVRHHLIDVLDLDETNNAESFARMARDAVEDIIGRGKLPVLVGGSGLYFRAVFEGLFDIDLDIREREAFARSRRGVATGELLLELSRADPESAGRIHSNDRYRILRALEIFELTGIPMSEHFHRQRRRRTAAGRRYLKVGLRLPRKELHARIEERARRMISSGWIEEVARLLDSGADPDWPGMKTLGYPQVIDHVMGKRSLDETTDTIIRLTKQYAKRQMTWFRSEPDVNWHDAGEVSTPASVTLLASRARIRPACYRTKHNPSRD